MAIDVDWAGNDANPYRIYVPRADMPIIQVSPELRTLDVDAFRLELGDLMSSEEGIPYPKTHDHISQYTISGITYARAVAIVPPYVVEFEDGQYGVLATGANHNLMDITVQNQVRLAVQNSAGLIVEPTNVAMSTAIAHMPKIVYYDSLGGGAAGEDPAVNGTQANPVDNWAQAKIIAAALGTKTIDVTGLITLTEATNGYTFEGQGALSPAAEVALNGQDVDLCVFRNTRISGAQLGGYAVYEGCTLTNTLTGFGGRAIKCAVQTALGLGDHWNRHELVDCYSVEYNAPLTISFDGAGEFRKVDIVRFAGSLSFADMANGFDYALVTGMAGESLELQASCTAGGVKASGIARLIDASTGMTNDTASLLDPADVAATAVAVAHIPKEIWFGTGSGGDTPGVNGTEDNPVDNETDLLSLATQTGVKTVRLVSQFTPTVPYTGWKFKAGIPFAIFYANAAPVVTMDDCRFEGIQVAGDFGHVNGERNEFYECKVLFFGNSAGTFDRCTLAVGGFSLADGPTYIRNCNNDLTSSPSVIDLSNIPAGVGVLDLNVDNFTGRLTLENLVAGLTTEYINIEITGTLTIEATMLVGVNIKVRGSGEIINNSAIVIDDSEFVHASDISYSATALAHQDKVVWMDQLGISGQNPDTDGIETNPVNNFEDAVAIAGLLGTKHIRFMANTFLTFDRDFIGWRFTGKGTGAFVVLGGYSIDNSTFERVNLRGDTSYPYNAVYDSCGVGGGVGGGGPLATRVIDSALQGEILITDNAGTTVLRCSQGSTTFPPKLDFSGVSAGNSRLAMLEYAGNVTLRNLSDAAYQVTLDIQGTVTLDATMTDGSMVLSGRGTLIDNSGPGFTVDSSRFMDEALDIASGQRVTDVWEMEGLAIGESKTMVRPTGDGLPSAGSITVNGRTFTVEQQGGGDTVILTRTA